MLRENRLEEACIVGVFALPGEDHGGVVRHLTVEDPQIPITVVRLRIFTRHEAPRETHIFTRERFAVVPTHTFLQRPGHSHRAVRGIFNQPVLFAWDLLCEDWDVRVVLVCGDETFDHTEVDVHKHLTRERIQYVDLTLVRDTENLPAVDQLERIACLIAAPERHRRGNNPDDGA